MKAMRNDDFNAILELKMKGYQPSEKVLKILQPDISATTFIAAAKIFQMEEVLRKTIISTGILRKCFQKYLKVVELYIK